MDLIDLGPHDPPPRCNLLDGSLSWTSVKPSFDLGTPGPGMYELFDGSCRPKYIGGRELKPHDGFYIGRIPDRYTLEEEYAKRAEKKAADEKYRDAKAAAQAAEDEYQRFHPAGPKYSIGRRLDGKAGGGISAKGDLSFAYEPGESFGERGHGGFVEGGEEFVDEVRIVLFSHLFTTGFITQESNDSWSWSWGGSHERTGL